MAFPAFHYNSKPESTQAEPLDQIEASKPPFTLFIAHQDAGQAGSWRPAASIQFDKHLRTSGFLLSLPPEDLKVLMMLLSFLTPTATSA